MKIYFFTKGNADVPSSRTRAFNVAHLLSLNSFDVETNLPNSLDFHKATFIKKVYLACKLFIILVSAKREDVFFLQRPIYNKYMFLVIMLTLPFKQTKVVFDFDDAIYVHSKFKTIVLIKLADAVIVGNRSLKSWVLNYSKNCHVIPTSIDYDLYSAAVTKFKNRNIKFTIGWLGDGSAHSENLKLLAVPLRELSTKYDIKLQLVGTKDYKPLKAFWSDNSHGYEIEMIDHLDWTENGIALKYVCNFDVGVMPLIDNSFNRGKCAYKALEYMACGVPVVLSPVGENNFLVDEGVNGYFATTDSDWIMKLEALILDTKQRNLIGISGQDTVRDKYSYNKNIAKIIRILKSI